MTFRVAAILLALSCSVAQADAPRVLSVDGLDQLAGGGFTSDGALILAGTYFKSVTLGDKTLKAKDDFRADFIARIEPDGKVAWLRAGKVGSEVIGIAVAADGSFAVGGVAEYKVGKDDGPATDWRTAATLGKFAADGTQVWKKDIRSKDRARISGVALASDGAVIACGSFSDITKFDAKTAPASVKGKFVPSTDAFVARFEPKDGALGWLTTAGGSDDDLAESVAIAPGGDVIVTGSVGVGPVAFGSLTLTGAAASTTVANPERLFVASLSPAGAPQWATQLGTGDWVRAHRIVAVDDHVVMATGSEQTGTVRTGVVARVVDGKVASHGLPDDLGDAAVDGAGAVTTRVSGTKLEIERYTDSPAKPVAVASVAFQGTVGKVALANGSKRVALLAELGERVLKNEKPAAQPMHLEIVLADKLEDLAKVTLK